MTRHDLTFTSPGGLHGTTCAAWHYPAADDRLATDAGRPVVVMAHGLGGTKDSGLEPFATAFAAAGLDVLAFDYRGFGASEGTPRQRVTLEEGAQASTHAADRRVGQTDDPARHLHRQPHRQPAQVDLLVNAQPAEHRVAEASDPWLIALDHGGSEEAR